MKSVGVGFWVRERSFLGIRARLRRGDVGAWLRVSPHDGGDTSPTGVATDEVPEAESVKVREVPIPESKLA